MTGRIAELRALIAEEERAYAAYRQDRSNRENYEHYRGAAKILGDALDRDTPALLDCAEALRDLLQDTQHAEHTCDDEVFCPVKNGHAALRALEGAVDD